MCGNWHLIYAVDHACAQVKHFQDEWKNKVQISERSFRRWRGKLYGGIQLTSLPSTVATSITNRSEVPVVPRCRRVLMFKATPNREAPRRPSIFDEESQEDQTQRPAIPRVPAFSVHDRRPHHVRTLPRGRPAFSDRRSQRVRWVPAPTHAALRRCELAERKAYLKIYQQHKKWTRERIAQGKAPPPMEKSVQFALKKHFNIVI